MIAWPEMWYRKRIRHGKLAWTCRVSRNGQPNPRRIVAVMNRNGEVMPPEDYSLNAFGHRFDGMSSGVVYFSRPTMTTGLTILFEAKA